MVMIMFPWPHVPVIALLVRTSSISEESLCIQQASVKQLLAGEESLLSEVAVEYGQEDQEQPDHQDHPQLLVLVHLILNNTSVGLEGVELGAFQNPFLYIGNLLEFYLYLRYFYFWEQLYKYAIVVLWSENSFM
jgi:hypothetical protein